MIFSLRLGDRIHFDSGYIDELIKAFKECGNCIDEVWLASSYGLLSKEQCKESAVYMGIAAKKAQRSRSGAVYADKQDTGTFAAQSYNVRLRRNKRT